MKPVTQELLRQAIDAFAFELPAGEAERFGAGHINDTFAVWSADRSRRWIVQRINTDTFTDPAGLMENITGVTAYLRRQIEARGGDAGRETLNVIPTRDGRAYYTETFTRWPRPSAISRSSWPATPPPPCTRPSPVSTTPPTATPTLKRPWPPT